MLRLLLLSFLTLSITACGVGESMRDSSKNNPKAHARVLAADNGCLGCHAVSVTVVGPAWKMVAKRYKAKPDAKQYLTNVIKHGGKGNWTNVKAGEVMPAHKDRMTDKEIAVVVDYILTL